jgi:hypothetical protein
MELAFLGALGTVMVKRRSFAVNFLGACGLEIWLERQEVTEKEAVLGLRRNQYSSGSRIVVTLRSASVMIQILVPLRRW